MLFSFLFRWHLVSHRYFKLGADRVLDAGDAAEISSISRVFCEETTRKSHLYVGSVKSHIGHLEAASGVAGIIKSIMILKNRQIPASLDFVEPKPVVWSG